MGKYATIKIIESKAELQRLLYLHKSERARKRIRAILHLKLGTFRTRKDLADDLKIGIRTLERWISKYKLEGMSILVRKETRNKKSKIIDELVHQRLAAKLNDSENPLLGYTDAVRWLKEELNIDIKYQNLRYYLIRHFHSKLKAPRKSHVKKDEKAGEAFLKTA